MYVVCLACQEAVFEEDGGDPETRMDLSAVARDLGADIPDHYCEAQGSCGCGCNDRR